MKDILVLFDVDGTLTEPRQKVKQEMIEFLKELKTKVTIGIIGGSDLKKQKEQLGEIVLNDFDYVFAENGLDAFKNNKQIGKQSFVEFLGEYNYKVLVNWILDYFGNRMPDVPVKRGTFIEYRNGMINVSPIGRQCSLEERNQFEEYDKIYKIRETMVNAMKSELFNFNLQMSIGGQISFDVFPEGWDKRYCLQFVENEGFSEIHFFGDKTSKGGNDYEIYEDERTIGHSVTSPEHTKQICKDLFF